MRRPLAVITAALALTVSVTACARGASSTAGADYPSEPITIIVGFDAGGSTDAGARLMAKSLEEKLGVTVTVENHPGAGGQVGYTELTRAEPDGYTMGTANFPSAIVSVLDESRGATYTRDSFVPVALQVVDPSVVAVAPDSPYRTAKDLVEAAKAAPGKLRAATTGVASNEHFALLQLKQETGAELAPVHFSEGAAPTTTAFLGGDVEVLVANVSDVKQLVESGKARVLGVMDSERSPFLPDVPTFAEQGYDVSISSSRGYAFPKGTPEEVVTTMSEAMGEIMKDESFRGRMKDLGLAPSYKNAQEYAAYWDETTQLFTELFPLVRAER